MKYKYVLLISFLTFVLTMHLNAQNMNFSISYSIQTVHLGANTDSSNYDNSTALVKIYPRNTRVWFCTFYTQAQEGAINGPGLPQQLFSEHLMDKSVVSDADLQKIKLPEGRDSIEVCLLQKNETGFFLKNKSLNDDSSAYMREGSFQRAPRGVARIAGAITDTLYLGLKNSSALHDSYIHIEFAFIDDSIAPPVKVKKKQIIREFNEQFDPAFWGDLGWDAFINGNYDACIRLSRKALERDKSLGYVYFNLGLAYLAKDQNLKAQMAYLKGVKVTRKLSQSQMTFQAAITDIKTYMFDFPSQEPALHILNKILPKY